MSGILGVCRIEREDAPAFVRMALLVLPASAVIAALQVITYSLFVFHVGMASISWRYIFSAVFLCVFGGFAMPALAGADSFRGYRRTVLGCSISLGVCALSMGAHRPIVFYLASAIAALTEALSYFVFWKMIYEVCESDRADRIFSPVVGLSVLGGAIGCIGTGIIVESIDASLLLFVSAVLLPTTLLAARALERVAYAGDPKPGAAPWSELKETVRAVRHQPLARLLIIGMLISVGISCLSDCLYNVMVVWKFTLNGEILEQKLVSFYAYFDAITAILTVAVYFFLIGPIMNRLGAARAQLLLPGVLCSGFSLVVVAGVLKETAVTLGLTLGMRLGQLLCANSVHAYAIDPIDDAALENESSATKDLRNATILQISYCVSGVAILLTETVPLVYLAGLSMAAAAVYLGVALRMKRVYLEEQEEDPGAGVLFPAARAIVLAIAGTLAAAVVAYAVMYALSFRSVGVEAVKTAAAPAGAQTGAAPASGQAAVDEGTRVEIRERETATAGARAAAEEAGEAHAKAEARVDEAAAKLEVLVGGMKDNPLLKSLTQHQNFFDQSQGLNKLLRDLRDEARRTGRRFQELSDTAAYLADLVELARNPGGPMAAKYPREAELVRASIARRNAEPADAGESGAPEIVFRVEPGVLVLSTENSASKSISGLSVTLAGGGFKDGDVIVMQVDAPGEPWSWKFTAGEPFNVSSRLKRYSIDLSASGRAERSGAGIAIAADCVVTFTDVAMVGEYAWTGSIAVFRDGRRIGSRPFKLVVTPGAAVTGP